MTGPCPGGMCPSGEVGVREAAVAATAEHRQRVGTKRSAKAARREAANSVSPFSRS